MGFNDKGELMMFIFNCCIKLKYFSDLFGV